MANNCSKTDAGHSPAEAWYASLLWVLEEQSIPHTIRSGASGDLLLKAAQIGSTGEVDLLCLSKGLYLISAYTSLDTPIELTVPQGDWVRLRSILSGTNHPVLPAKYLDGYGAKNGIVTFVDGADTVMDRIEPADGTIRLVDLWCERQLLEEYIAGDTDGLPSKFCQLLASNKATPYELAVHLTPTMERLVREIQNVPKQVVMKRLFLQFKTLGLIYELVAAMKSMKVGPASSLSRKDTQAVMAAYDILASHFIDPPSLAELSRSVGINRTVLAKGFKETFGVSTSELCLELKMDQAWHRLARTDEAVSQIAFDLGYDHTANFSTAVKRWFGQSPREIRQAG